jgi:hypothetical protein
MFPPTPHLNPELNSSGFFILYVCVGGSPEDSFGTYIPHLNPELNRSGFFILYVCVGGSPEASFGTYIPHLHDSYIIDFILKPTS